MNKDTLFQGAIFGKKGCGKTHLILNEMMPSLKDANMSYKAIDLINEYRFYTDDKNVIEIDYRVKELRDTISDIISKLEKDVFIFIDNANLLNFPCKISEENIEADESDMAWLMELLEGRSYCLVFNRVKTIYDNKIESKFENYLLFEPCIDTRFSEKLKNEFGDKVATLPNHR
jgi:hypothetical protein